MVQGTQSFRQVRAAKSVISYVLLVVCIALEVDDVGYVFEGGSLPAII